MLGPGSGGEYFLVGVAGFDLPAAVSKLRGLGLAAGVVRKEKAISFRIPTVSRRKSANNPVSVS